MGERNIFISISHWENIIQNKQKQKTEYNTSNKAKYFRKRIINGTAKIM